MSEWLLQQGDAVVLRLHVQPGARRDAIIGQHGEALKIHLAARPVNGRANAALLAFLAARAGVAKSALELISGASGRAKRVRVHGATAPQLAARLAADGERD